LNTVQHAGQEARHASAAGGDRATLLLVEPPGAAAGRGPARARAPRRLRAVRSSPPRRSWPAIRSRLVMRAAYFSRPLLPRRSPFVGRGAHASHVAPPAGPVGMASGNPRAGRRGCGRHGSALRHDGQAAVAPAVSVAAVEARRGPRGRGNSVCEAAEHPAHRRAAFASGRAASQSPRCAPAIRDAEPRGALIALRPRCDLTRVRCRSAQNNRARRWGLDRRQRLAVPFVRPRASARCNRALVSPALDNVDLRGIGGSSRHAQCKYLAMLIVDAKGRVHIQARQDAADKKGQTALHSPRR